MPLPPLLFLWLAFLKPPALTGYDTPVTAKHRSWEAPQAELPYLIYTAHLTDRSGSRYTVGNLERQTPGSVAGRHSPTQSTTSRQHDQHP